MQRHKYNFEHAGDDAAALIMLLDPGVLVGCEIDDSCCEHIGSRPGMEALCDR